MDEQKEMLSRRQFVQLAMLGGATVALSQALPEVKKSSAVEGASPYHWVMVIDLDICVGCQNCTLACKAHNDVNPDLTWNRIFEYQHPTGKVSFMPMPCQHCEHAPCVDACPVKAAYHRPDGIVAMDYDRCIGCRYCEVACPYGARVFNWSAFDGDNPSVPEWGEPEIERRPRGVVEKCSFCTHRIDRGLALGLVPGVDRDATPACVNACPTGARMFGDLNDPHSRVSQLLAREPYARLREDLGTEPRVYYLHLSRNVVETEVCS